MKNNFFRFDSITEPFNTLKMTEDFLFKIANDEYYSKWAIIAMHNSLQGFMVLALRGTNDLQVIKDSPENKNKNFYEILSNPSNNLIGFMDLFKRIKKEKYMKLYVDSKVFTCNDCTYNAINELNIMRNNLNHFLLSGYSIQIDFFVHCMEESLKVIDFLINYSGNIHHYSDDEIKSINNIITNIKQLLIDLKSCQLK